MTLARRTPLKAKTPMRKISTKRAKRRASPEGQADLAHMRRVRSLPCVICYEWGMKQTSPTEAHHPIHDRYSARKSPDSMVIPLCVDHHRESRDQVKVAIHSDPSKWRRLYGPDHEWVAWVRVRLGLDE